jgi:hypothetical protein
MNGFIVQRLQICFIQIFVMCWSMVSNWSLILPVIDSGVGFDEWFYHAVVAGL